MQPPFVCYCDGDVAFFDSVSEMSASVEVYDLSDSEFFDAVGRRLEATPNGYTVQLAAAARAPEPERLEQLLRTYFRALERALPAFTQRAEGARDLSELVALREELRRAPTRRWWRRS